MTKQERKVIFIGAGVVIIALLIVLITNEVSKKNNINLGVQNMQTEQNTEKYATMLEDGTKINTSNAFNKTRRYKDIEISNVQFTYKDGISVLLADVKNVGSTKHESEVIKMTILDENNQEIEVIQPIIPKIEAGETEQMNAIISGANSVNAKDFRIEEQ